jgi:molybdenum cofactor biosynthesis enzyme MoaA
VRHVSKAQREVIRVDTRCVCVCAVTKNRVSASSAASHLALLEEKDAALQSAALRRLNVLVDEFWPEIYESIEVMSGSD